MLFWGNKTYMVSPLPNKTAHQPLLPVDDIDVFLDSAGTIAHGMLRICKQRKEKKKKKTVHIAM
jgi:hypothetical protein